MKNREENTKGWFEEKDPLSGKAKRHSEVAIREKLKGTLRTPLTAPLKHESKDKEEDENFADEIVEEVQESRKPSAVSKDNAKIADKVGDKKDAEDLVDWIKEPSKSDLQGVDTKSNTSKKYEAEKE